MLKVIKYDWIINKRYKNFMRCSIFRKTYIYNNIDNVNTNWYIYGKIICLWK